MKTQWVLCKKNETEQCWLLSSYHIVRAAQDTHIFSRSDLIYFSCNKYIAASSTFKEAHSFKVFFVSRILFVKLIILNFKVKLSLQYNGLNQTVERLSLSKTHIKLNSRLLLNDISKVRLYPNFSPFAVVLQLILILSWLRCKEFSF